VDHYQVRTWTGCHRFIILAMLALAFLMNSRPHFASLRRCPG
jgi:hypothetical protein